MGQESWNQKYSSGMNNSPAMAPVSPGLGGSQPLSSVSPKKTTTFQSLGSLSSGRFSPSLARSSAHQAKQASTAMNSPTLSIMSSPKLWQKASVSRLAEEFFWIGGSVVAQPKWRLGQIGKSHSLILPLKHLNYCRLSTGCCKVKDDTLTGHILVLHFE